jgi:hypothetical protein
MYAEVRDRAREALEAQGQILENQTKENNAEAYSIYSEGLQIGSEIYYRMNNGSWYSGTDLAAAGFTYNTDG